MKIIIDPRSSYAYGSFYVYGLQSVFGKKNISYSVDRFRELDSIGNDICFIVQDDHVERKYFIHAHDAYYVLEQAYNWCDVYASVNTNYAQYPKEQYPKLVSLAPSFGIQIESSLVGVAWHALFILLNTWKYEWNRVDYNKYTQRDECNHLRNIKRYFSWRYKTWKNRLPLSVYTNTIPSDDNYIFFLSTLWYSNEINKNDEGVNLRRAQFIRACKSIPDCHFEGGLLGGDDASKNKFSDVLASHGEPFDSWIGKTKRSTLVFNTPAFHNCHGWKLGEYLALGKCIVSTKLSNDLPHPLEHGVNIHFVENNEESMREAVEYILTHPDYRHKLEKGAREYWETYGTPKASLKLLGIE